MKVRYFRKLVLLLILGIRLTSIINLCSSLSDNLLPSMVYDLLNRQLNVGRDIFYC